MQYVLHEATIQWEHTVEAVSVVHTIVHMTN